MYSILSISIINMILAVTLYTIGVWSERFAGRLKLWHLIFFWVELIFDTAGTTLMVKMAGGLMFDFHGITGALAIVLMLGHTLWASAVLLLKQEKMIVNFHKYSLVAWILWLIPFVSGLVRSMIR